MCVLVFKCVGVKKEQADVWLMSSLGSGSGPICEQCVRASEEAPASFEPGKLVSISGEKRLSGKLEIQCEY